jgi:hypothetical protein
MKLELESPTWYSRESQYASQVKSTDVTLTSPTLDFSKVDIDFTPSQDDIELVRTGLVTEIVSQTSKWFTSPLTVNQVLKRIVFDFPKFDYQPQEKWVQAIWIPFSFHVKKSGFVLTFKIQSLKQCSPRIPLSFFESVTPRATTPTEPKREEVRNIVLQPGAGPNDMEQVDDIPLSETLTSFEIRDERLRERNRLRQAKLRAAIARLKVEEMKERYLRQYGDEYLGESSDSGDEDSSLESEISEPVPKK